jgi:hypothetical protein
MPTIPSLGNVLSGDAPRGVATEARDTGKRNTIETVSRISNKSPPQMNAWMLGEVTLGEGLPVPALAREV